ncbi:MAG: hypothetical protein U5K43_05925 [Halofilum sp. (in: g-proteobacteria)]|nr:hypothetical protein [Halofilum sp. (in: g-proteobacteria)]
MIGETPGSHPGRAGGRVQSPIEWSNDHAFETHSRGRRRPRPRRRNGPGARRRRRDLRLPRGPLHDPRRRRSVRAGREPDVTGLGLEGSRSFNDQIFLRIVSDMYNLDGPGGGSDAALDMFSVGPGIRVPLNTPGTATLWGTFNYERASVGGSAATGFGFDVGLRMQLTDVIEGGFTVKSAATESGNTDVDYDTWELEGAYSLNRQVDITASLLNGEVERGNATTDLENLVRIERPPALLARPGHGGTAVAGPGPRPSALQPLALGPGPLAWAWPFGLGPGPSPRPPHPSTRASSSSRCASRARGCAGTAGACSPRAAPPRAPGS